MAIPKMGVPPEALEQQIVLLDEGLYDARLSAISVAKGKKDPASYNYRFIYDITGQQRPDGKPVQVSIFASSKAGWIQNDVVHGLGMVMEELQDKTLAMPGEFDGPLDDPTKWAYRGPMLNRPTKFYLIKTTNNGKTYNNIKYFVCAVPDCATRFPKMQHTKDLTGNK